jgi:large subunit ribosomal protein L25
VTRELRRKFSLQTFDLKASERKGTGKGAARGLRRQGLVPAVLYGPKTEPMALTISAVDLEKVYEESGSEHVILNLIIENGDTQNRTAMVKEIQTSPLTSQYLHIDFYEISLEQEITVKVQVEITGKCKGVENGGFLQLIRHELEDIDVSDKVRLLYDSNFTVVTVVAPTVEEEEVVEEELEEAEEIAAETEAEEETANE